MSIAKNHYAKVIIKDVFVVFFWGMFLSLYKGSSSSLTF